MTALLLNGRSNMPAQVAVAVAAVTWHCDRHLVLAFAWHRSVRSAVSQATCPHRSHDGTPLQTVHRYEALRDGTAAIRPSRARPAFAPAGMELIGVAHVFLSGLRHGITTEVCTNACHALALNSTTEVCTYGCHAFALNSTAASTIEVCTASCHTLALNSTAAFNHTHLSTHSRSHLLLTRFITHSQCPIPLTPSTLSTNHSFTCSPATLSPHNRRHSSFRSHQRSSAVKARPTVRSEYGYPLSPRHHSDEGLHPMTTCTYHPPTRLSCTRRCVILLH